jgi:hypothetical protein
MSINLAQAVRGAVGNAVRESKKRLELEELSKKRLELEELCVICGKSKGTNRRIRFEIGRDKYGGYIHASCAEKAYIDNKASTDAATRAKGGKTKGPCALCGEDVTDLDERIRAFNNTAYIHMLCVKTAHEGMQ